MRIAANAILRSSLAKALPPERMHIHRSDLLDAEGEPAEVLPQVVRKHMSTLIVLSETLFSMRKSAYSSILMEREAGEVL